MSNEIEYKGVTETPMTNEETHAWNAYRAAPISCRKFFQLYDFIEKEPEINGGDGRDLIVAFIRKHRLPKAKILSWMADFKIEKDGDLIPMIFRPLEEQYLREEKDSINQMIAGQIKAEIEEELLGHIGRERAKMQR